MTVTQERPAEASPARTAAPPAAAPMPTRSDRQPSRATLAAAGRMVRNGWRRLRRKLAPVTVLGWAALGAAVALFVVSRFTGWQELAVAAAGLAAAFVASALFLVGLSRYEVTLDLTSHRVVVGRPAAGRVLVRNAAGRRLLPVRMELRVGTGRAAISVPSLAARADHEETFRINTRRRGVIQVGPVQSVRGDGFGLMRRERRWTESELIYVHPVTVSLHGSSPGFIKDLEGQTTRELSNNDVSFHALRGYSPGDDRRYIHWKTSARTGVLMVRQFEETRRSHVSVSVATAVADYRTDEEFEIAIAAGASIGLQTLREERTLSVLAGSEGLRTRTARQLLDGVSAVERSSAGADVLGAARHTVATVPEVSVAFLVCGSVPSPHTIRSAATAFPLGVRVIVVRVAEGAAMRVRKFGVVPVLTIGALAELPRGLRAVAR